MENISYPLEETREKLQRFPGEPKTGQRRGWTVISNATITDEKLNSHELRIFIVVLSHKYKRNYAEAGIRLISKESRMSPGTVKKYVKNLEEKGYWKIVKKRGCRTKYFFILRNVH